MWIALRLVLTWAAMENCFCWSLIICLCLGFFFFFGVMVFDYLGLTYALRFVLTWLWFVGFWFQWVALIQVCFAFWIALWFWFYLVVCYNRKRTVADKSNPTMVEKEERGFALLRTSLVESGRFCRNGKMTNRLWCSVLSCWKQNLWLLKLSLSNGIA